MIYRMKAVFITERGDPSVLVIRQVSPPSVGPEDLLVRVKATSLNRADLLQRKGMYPAPQGTRQDIPGLEFAGVVDSVGPQAGAYAEGDHVMGLLPGEAHAEFVATPAATVLRIPENLTFEEAAAIPEAFLTAHDALSSQLELKTGEGVLIHAVGSGVGTAAVQLAEAVGALTFGTSTTDLKLTKAKELGLKCGINSRKFSFSDQIKEKTRGRGVEVILDLVGASNWHSNLKCLTPLGRMLLVGLVGGSQVEADLSIILQKRLRIMGTVLRSRNLKEKTKVVRRFREEGLPLFREGTIRPVIDSIFPIEEVAKAHEHMEQNRNFGKIVLSGFR